IHSFAGNYEEYLQRYVTGAGVTGEEGRGPGSVMKTSEDAARDARKRERMLSREDEKKRLREEKARMKRLAELEARILESEEILAILERDMGDPDYFRDADRAREGAKEHAALTVLIENLYQEWEAVQPDVA
ncbi:MAG: ABC transporter ATP-binding protein, partial [Geobacteraceae bacterium]|nr:ABC transporter ATP-binding protein [Geobacteraceae bacterium]